ncbi:MAG: 4-hydroxy-tetrahydrodipicolinate reductase, partial [Thermodesulfovibrionia bacterium]|nr:4-hydroxy-tetrahydrodipicolinate reductase [Thermodesulfovibrionia bacterium]
MLNITVIGAAGKMGSRVITLAKDNEDINLVGAVENRAHKGIGQDIGDIIAIGSTGIKLISDIRAVADKTDVCIDFSHPESTLQCIKALSDKPVPLIIGTTGLGKDGT